MGLQVFGLAAMLQTFNEITEHAREIGQKEYWVGTVVFYGPFLEFGTADVTTYSVRSEARPHWRPAVNDIRAKFGLPTDEEMMEELVVEDGHLARLVAVALERRVKERIRMEGLIDTGNYRGSITAGPTFDATWAASAAAVIDPTTIATQGQGA